MFLADIQLGLTLLVQPQQGEEYVHEALYKLLGIRVKEARAGKVLFHFKITIENSKIFYYYTHWLDSSKRRNDVEMIWKILRFLLSFDFRHHNILTFRRIQPLSNTIFVNG